MSDISNPIKNNKNFLKQNVKIKINKFNKIIFFKLFFKNTKTIKVIKILNILNKIENWSKKKNPKQFILGFNKEGILKKKQNSQT